MFQQITIVGRLGQDPESRFTPSGKQVTSFSLAIDRHKGGDKTTLWVRCTAWEQTAEACAKYLSKGSQVLVIGEVEEPRVFTDKSGNQRASLDVTARSVKFLSSKGDAQRVEHVGNVTVDDATEIPF
jgi:single-strand DNA-binding protein